MNPESIGRNETGNGKNIVRIEEKKQDSNLKKSEEGSNAKVKEADFYTSSCALSGRSGGWYESSVTIMSPEYFSKEI